MNCPKIIRSFPPVHWDAYSRMLPLGIAHFLSCIVNWQLTAEIELPPGSLRYRFVMGDQLTGSSGMRVSRPDELVGYVVVKWCDIRLRIYSYSEMGTSLHNVHPVFYIKYKKNSLDLTRLYPLSIVKIVRVKHPQSYEWIHPLYNTRYPPDRILENLFPDEVPTDNLQIVEVPRSTVRFSRKILVRNDPCTAQGPERRIKNNAV